ncbi:MAG: PaaI family thioesterase [Promethearchaeota archaeon]|jgi:acyl-CoA thioesterase
MAKKIPLQSKGFDPFGDLIGLEFTKLEKGHSQCKLKITPQLLNPHKVLHGAVSYALADTGMGAALYSSLEEGQLCATVEIKITYFKPVTTGTLVCETKVINKGKRISTLESKITNNERLVSKAYGTFSIFQIRK